MYEARLDPEWEPLRHFRGNYCEWNGKQFALPIICVEGEYNFDTALGWILAGSFRQKMQQYSR